MQQFACITTTTYTGARCALAGVPPEVLDNLLLIVV